MRFGDLVAAPGTASDEHELTELLRAFLAGRGASSTQRAYANDLGIPRDLLPHQPAQPAEGPRRGRRAAAPNELAWLPWCLREQLRAPAARPRDVERWLEELAGHGYARDTRARMLSAVTALYRYLIGHELAEDNPAAALDRRDLQLNRPKDEPPKTKRWTLEQCRALLEAAWLLAPHTRNGLRDRAMTEILIGVAPRGEELVGVNLDDYRRASPDGRGDLTVHGLSGKNRTLGLSVPACDAVGDYLAVRDPPATLEPSGQGEGAPAPLFLTRTGVRVHVSHVTAMLRQLVAAFVPDAPPRPRWHQALLATTRAANLAKVLGPLAGTIHPHSNRHAYGTLAVEHGVPAHQVRRDLGLEDPRSTEHDLAEAVPSTGGSGAHDLDDALHRGWWTPRTTVATSARSTTPVPDLAARPE